MPNRKSWFSGKPWLALSAGLMGLYLLLVLWAKFAKTIGPPPFKLGDTGEFLLFLAVIIAFVVEVIRSETQGKEAKGDTGEHS